MYIQSDLEAVGKLDVQGNGKWVMGWGEGCAKI